MYRKRFPLLAVLAAALPLMIVSTAEAGQTATAPLAAPSADAIASADDLPAPESLADGHHRGGHSKKGRAGRPDNPGGRGRGRGPSWAPGLNGNAGGGSGSFAVTRPPEGFAEAGPAPDLVWPVEGRITSRFGRRHRGLDIAVQYEPVVAAADGRVLFSGGRRCCGYGLYVDVQHENGYVTRYAHLSSSSVRAGDAVAAGATIGMSGDTGRSSGPHLHFELTWSGYALNPLSYLP